MLLFNLDIIDIILKLIQDISVIFTFTIIFIHFLSINYIKKTESPWSIQPKGIVFFLLISILTVMFPLQISIEPRIIIDLRMTSVVLSGIYLGITDSIIIGIFTLFMRYMVGGIGWMLWLPSAIIIGPLTWVVFNKLHKIKANRIVILVFLSLLATLISASFFTFISIKNPLFSMFSPLLNLDNFCKIFIPLFICNPISIVVIDWALCHIKKQQENITDLKHLADIDGMTELYNHRSFQLLLSETIEITKRNKSSVCLLMMDLDHFKAYNDTFGHQRGDEVLRNLGIILTKSVREMDIVARYGGEEFAVILPNTSITTATIVADRIRESVECFSFDDEEEFSQNKVTISIGVAEYPLNAENKSLLVEVADAALYRAKNLGGNRVICA